MTFDIIVFDEDEMPDGSMGIKQHAENGVQASSRKELIGLYAMLGQKIKIIREYGGPTTNEPINTAACNVKSSTVNAAPVKHPDAPPPRPNTTVVAQPAETPKFYKIGDIEIKIENGVSYQKQFLRLTDSEASNIRVVDDKTNKVINLNNKHIEMKRWVKVESNSTDETASLEDSLK